MIPRIAERRLQNQLLTRAPSRRAADVVGWLGAVQAQEYEAAKWALGLRMQEGMLDAGIQRAFDEGRVLRTHVMRPTWHFVTPADIRWLLDLTAPRVQRAMASYSRQLELDVRTLARGTAIIERALRDRRYLIRTELGDRLQRLAPGIAGQRLAHLVMHAELEGVICSGPRRGKRFTYALLAERAPHAQRLSRDEALAALTRRFFRSHGPAMVRDFVWWSSLTSADAKRGLEIIRARPEEIEGHHYWTFGSAPDGETRDHAVHLLPVYDEYLVAYRDRNAVPHGPSAMAVRSGGPGSFQHPLIIAGQVAGTWRPERHGQGVLVHARPLRPWSARERRALAEAADRYGQFLSAPVTLSIG